MSETELRKDPRVGCRVPAIAQGPRGPIRGTCVNLSAGGLFFLGQVLPIGSTVTFTLELPSRRKVEVLGEVRHHQRLPEGSGMGIKLTRISQEDLAAIQQLIEAP
jgi:hypothetical protein